MFTETMLESIKKVEATRAERMATEPRRMTAEEKSELLKAYHPDYRAEGFKEIKIGPNKGEKAPVELADLLHSNSRLLGVDVDLTKIDYDVDGVEKANFDLKEVDFFACVVGAGSFTGIRIAVSTIKAFCVAYKKPCLSITSFDTLAYNKQGEKVLAVIDAKHDAFYVCGYDNGKVVYPPAYVDKQTLLGLANEYMLVSSEEIDGIKTEKVDLLSGLINAVECKKDIATFNVESLVPLYVRKSQAEEGR